MNIVSAVSWTDIPTEVMATSMICNQDSVKICSLAVNMNNTDEKLLPVLRIHDILGWIRIRGSMPLTDGSGFGFGSGSWIRILDPDPSILVIDLQDASKKLIF